MKRAAHWTSALARERAVDWLIAAGTPQHLITKMVGVSLKSFRRIRERLHGEVHRDRIRWLAGIVRWASNNGLDVRTCEDFNRLHADLTQHCLVHLEESPGCVNPGEGCKLCRKRNLRAPPLPQNFPYRVEAKWNSDEGGFVATAPMFPELRVVAETIHGAKRELREIGTRQLQEAIQVGRPVPKSDIRTYTRRGLSTAMQALNEARKQPKPERSKPKPLRKKKVELAPGEMPGGIEEPAGFE